MRLWQRAAGALKDHNSLWISSLSRRTSLRNPDIEAAVIKATSHDEFSVDFKNTERVYRWLRLSDAHIKPLVRCLSTRMDKTRSWSVALKGLMLMHGIFTSKVPVVQKIGRLPFDLSNFTDGYAKPGEIWAHNAFIRSYYAFLDQKSTLLFVNMQERKGFNIQQQRSLMQDLILLQKLQGLLDMLVQIKPLSRASNVFLIVEALECILIEVFDIYSRICHMVARVLKRIYSARKVEAAMAVRVLKKAIVQGDELSSYFELCREIGVSNATGCPQIVSVPESDIRELERMINEISEKSSRKDDVSKQKEEARAIVPKQQDGRLRTVITDNWEKFDEDLRIVSSASLPIMCANNPFLSPPSHHHHSISCPDLPDLITF